MRDEKIAAYTALHTWHSTALIERIGLRVVSAYEA
jgi:hypothetical protein